MEDVLVKSLENTENLFGSNYFQAATDALGLIEIGPITTIIQTFADLLSNTEGWKTELARAITDEAERKKVETIIFLMETKIRHIKEQLEYLRSQR